MYRRLGESATVIATTVKCVELSIIRNVHIHHNFCLQYPHRISALKNLEWKDTIRCMCYRNIPDDGLRKILADGERYTCR